MNIAIRKWLDELRQQLWFRPLIFCILGIAAPLLARVSDKSFLPDELPNVERAGLETMLDVMAASMLVIAVFAVGAMLNAFSAATTTTTPRSFRLIIADNVSQNALSAFLGSFIYSIIALVALKNEYYGKNGLFILFAITMLVFFVVTLTLLRWVNRISRLGRMEHTIKTIETITASALQQHPALNGRLFHQPPQAFEAVTDSRIGFVQYLDMPKLQSLAEKLGTDIYIKVRPGHYVTPNDEIAWVKQPLSEEDSKTLLEAIPLDRQRNFEEPRFGLIALSEIASRAMSPAVNDPGTAIAIIHSLVRLFAKWAEQACGTEIKFPQVHLRHMLLHDLFTDAFRPVSRDGAANVEVMTRLQKAYRSLYGLQHPELQQLAKEFSADALQRAEESLVHDADKEEVRRAALVTLLKEK